MLFVVLFCYCQCVQLTPLIVVFLATVVHLIHWWSQQLCSIFVYMQGLVWTCCSFKVNMPIPIGRCHWILGERKVPLLHSFINNWQAWLWWVSSHWKQQCARWKPSCDTSCYRKYDTAIRCSDEWYVMPTRRWSNNSHFLPTYRRWRWRLRSYFSSKNSLHLSLANLGTVRIFKPSLNGAWMSLWLSTHNPVRLEETQPLFLQTGFHTHFRKSFSKFTWNMKLGFTNTLKAWFRWMQPQSVHMETLGMIGVQWPTNGLRTRVFGFTKRAQHFTAKSPLCTTDQPLAAVHASLDTMARQTSSSTLTTRGCLVMVSSFSTCTWWWKEGTLSFCTKGMKYLISLLSHTFILYHGKHSALNTTVFLCFNVGLCNALTQV